MRVVTNTALGLVVLNVLFVFLAIPLPIVRRLILDPTGSKILGLFFGKYLITDVLIRFVRPIRLGLFRDYRRNLLSAPVVTKWESHLYIPQNVALAVNNGTSAEGPAEDWQSFFDTLLKRSAGRVWLLVGKSGLGKTALLEKWVYQSLKGKKTPIFIHLGSGLSTSAEVAAVMEQYGDINVKPRCSLGLIKRRRVRDFAGRLKRRPNTGYNKRIRAAGCETNLIAMSSQFDPYWDKFLEVSRIDLKPFGREQLLKITSERWVNKILAADYLADLAKLPHTAQLLANYIEENQRLPPLRLDIYRNLTKSFEGDTQILNLEAEAWRLFRENAKTFPADEIIPKSFCDLAVESGILTRAGNDYQFRHELIHRFFVACYLQRQGRKPLKKWHQQVREGLGQGYWSDALELWGELYAERAPQHPLAIESYYCLLQETADFSPQIFAERLFPQLSRLYQAGTLQKDPQFIEWAANVLAPAAAQLQEQR